MAFFTKPALGTPLDLSHPLMRDIAVAVVDYDGFPLDMVSGERPSAVTSPGSVIDTPCGPAWGYNGSGYIRFAPTDLHNHSLTGEWTYFCKFMYTALGAYGTPVKHALTTSTNPYSQWAFELTGAGYLVSYIRTAAGSRTGTPNVNPALGVGQDNTLAAVVSVPGNLHGVYKNGTYQTGNTCPSLYYSASGTTLELGTAFTGAVHVVFAWPRVLAADEIVWLHENIWDVFEDSRKPLYVDMGAGGSTQDASHVASGGATSGGSADSSREQAAQGAGGATSGGAASTAREVLSTGSGGASTGGAAQSSKEAGHVASGGGVSGGAAGASTGAVQDVSHVASGGAVSGGAAASTRESAAQASGGASAGGSAASARESASIGQGGAVSSGQASQAREATATGSGGAVSGGAAVASASTAGDSEDVVEATVPGVFMSDITVEVAGVLWLEHVVPGSIH